MEGDSSYSLNLAMVEEVECTPIPTYYRMGPVTVFTCYYCGESRTNLHKLSIHIKRRHKSVFGTANSKHKCTHCSFVSICPSTLVQHVITNHSETKTLMCIHCEYGTSRIYDMRRHLGVMHKDQSPGFVRTRQKEERNAESVYDCPHCVFKTTREHRMKNHIKNIHQEEIPMHAFQCVYCQYSTSRADHMKKHLERRHNEPVPHGFIRTGEPAWKKKRKTVEQTVRDCPHCEFKTTKEYVMLKHIENTHEEGNTNGPNEKAFQCVHCDHTSFRLDHMKKHLKSKHKDELSIGYIRNGRVGRRKKKKPVDEPLHDCPLCPFKGAKEYHMKRHMLHTHGDENFYKCQQCLYSTPKSSNLKQHIMSIHTKVKPHQCPLCQQRFTYSGHMKKHIASQHLHEKPHECGFCHEKFASRSYMKEHVMVKHTKEKPFQCPSCSYRSTRSTYVKKHMIIKHSNVLALGGLDASLPPYSMGILRHS